MFVALQRAGKAGITIARLIDAIYEEDASGGPLTAKNVVHVQRWKMKDALAKFGMKITTTKGHGSLWRLEKI
jgi:predicted DNA-binding ribbon-helix-helix protein